MALLWRAPGQRTGPGPKPGLSVDAIVVAAIAVADTDGLAGLSMWAVAERLGVTAMALYTYVPGKDELVDLMYDGAHAELTVGYDLGAGWRAAADSASEQAWWSGRTAALGQVAPDFTQRFPDSAWLAGASAAPARATPSPTWSARPQRRSPSG